MRSTGNGAAGPLGPVSGGQPIPDLDRRIRGYPERETPVSRSSTTYSKKRRQPSRGTATILSPPPAGRFAPGTTSPSSANWAWLWISEPSASRMFHVSSRCAPWLRRTHSMSCPRSARSRATVSASRLVRNFTAATSGTSMCASICSNRLASSFVRSAPSAASSPTACRRAGRGTTPCRPAPEALSPARAAGPARP